jgi:hypothetical protein
VSGLTGFQFVDLREEINFDESLVTPPTGSPQTFATLNDNFRTDNQFYGGQLGADLKLWSGNWVLDTRTIVALGFTDEHVRVSGFTNFTDTTGTTSVFQGGLLAQPTNIGTRHKDRFAVLPSLQVRASYFFTDHVSVSVGYTFMYLSDVVRPEDQIDRVINASILPSNTGPGSLVGPQRPAPLNNSSDFWAQGVDFGFAIRF